jgi:hypothetical protein
MSSAKPLANISCSLPAKSGMAVTQCRAISLCGFPVSASIGLRAKRRNRILNSIFSLARFYSAPDRIQT